MKIPFFLAALLHIGSLLSMVREVHQVETSISTKPKLTITNETSQNLMITSTYGGLAKTITLPAGSRFEILSPEKLENLEIVYKRLLLSTHIKAYERLKEELSQAQAQRKNLLLEITHSSSLLAPANARYTYAERHKDHTENHTTLDDLFPLAKAARKAQKEIPPYYYFNLTQLPPEETLIVMYVRQKNRFSKLLKDDPTNELYQEASALLDQMHDAILEGLKVCEAQDIIPEPSHYLYLTDYFPVVKSALALNFDLLPEHFLNQTEHSSLDEIDQAYLREKHKLLRLIKQNPQDSVFYNDALQLVVRAHQYLTGEKTDFIQYVNSRLRKPKDYFVSIDTRPFVCTRLEDLFLLAKEAMLRGQEIQPEFVLNLPDFDSLEEVYLQKKEELESLIATTAQPYNDLYKDALTLVHYAYEALNGGLKEQIRFSDFARLHICMEPKNYALGSATDSPSAAASAVNE